MKFILDSGANYHIISSKNGLYNLHKVDVVVELAEGETEANFAGTAFVKMKGDRRDDLLKLEDCLVVEDAETNLISISKLEKQGYSVEFIRGEARLRRKGFTEFIVQRSRDGMYEMNGEIMRVV